MTDWATRIRLSPAPSPLIPLSSPCPQGIGGAFAYSDYTALTAALGGVQSVFIRTIDEALGIPTEETHAQTYESANWFFNVIRGQHINMQSRAIEEEARIAELEIRSILDKLLEIGNGDIVVGCLKGVEQGVLDSSFSPNKQVKDQVIGVKDCNGAVRYKDFGNLPLPEEVKQFHREKVAEREKTSGMKADYEMTVRDFWHSPGAN